MIPVAFFFNIPFASLFNGETFNLFIPQ
jgi:hypothetical protein